jgi:CBS domain-containing protein
MNAKEICSRSVAIAERGTNLREAARLMREHHVGALVVVEKREGATFPVGMITDRDIVVEVIAVAGVRPESLTVGDVMTNDVATVPEGCGVFEAIELMCDKGVRRLPVVTPDGRLVGLLALDDLLRVLSVELSGLAAAVQRAGVQEVQSRVVIDDVA